MAKEPKPNRPDDAVTGGRATPPYEGRRESADVAGKEKSSKGGAKTGGATGPVEDDDMKAADPKATPGGPTRSPSDERPAKDASRSRPRREDDATGPSHQPGTRRAEDQS